MSFYGYQSNAIGYFDEAIHDSVVLWIGGTIGPLFQGSIYYFGFLSKGHENIGFEFLSDTRVDCPEFPCTQCDYRLYASFIASPDELIIGGVSGGCCDQAAQLSGNSWLGYEPTAFTHLYIKIDAHEPLNICPKYFLIPIVWVSEPVPTEEDSWGRIKAIYQ